MTERMKGLGESKLRDFALDVPTGSVYHFEGEDFREKKKVNYLPIHLLLCMCCIDTTYCLSLLS